MNPEELKLIVKEKYKEIVLNINTGCCGNNGCCGDIGYSMIGDDYNQIEGHNPDADLGLGCGIPVQYAAIKPGNSVLDLGSGAGNDCFIARSLVGETGHITGLDFTYEMVEKARMNNLKAGFLNVDFVLGDIEEMPFRNDSFDVVISNCVLNLVPDKEKAFSQIFRVLKPGGHFCVSDVVIKGKLPENLVKEAELYAGCIAGAENMNVYIDIIRCQGFQNITVHKIKKIEIPPEILRKYDPTSDTLISETGIYSITISGYKN